MVVVQRPGKIMGKPIDGSDTPTDTQVVTYDDASGLWIADTGGGVSKFIIGSAIEDTAADSNTEYCAPFGQLGFSTSESQRGFIAPFAFTLKSLKMDLLANTNTANTIVTIRVDAVDTALTITVPASTGGEHTVDADVAVAEDAQISFEVDNTLNTGTFSIDSWSCECQA